MDILAYLMSQQQAQQSPALWDTFRGLMSEEIARGTPQSATPEVTYNTFEGGTNTTTVNTSVPPFQFPDMGGGGGGGYTPPQQPAPQKKEKPKSKYQPNNPSAIDYGGNQNPWDVRQKQGPDQSSGWSMNGAQKPMTQGFGGYT